MVCAASILAAGIPLVVLQHFPYLLDGHVLRRDEERVGACDNKSGCDNVPKLLIARLQNDDGVIVGNTRLQFLNEVVIVRLFILALEDTMDGAGAAKAKERLPVLVSFLEEQYGETEELKDGSDETRGSPVSVRRKPPKKSNKNRQFEANGKSHFL